MLSLGTVVGLIKSWLKPVETDLTDVKNAIQGLGLTVNNSGELCVSFEQEDDEE